MRDVCDLAYLVFIEQQERRATAQLSALIAAGRDVDMWQALEDGRKRFDEALVADPRSLPSGVDAEEMELRKLLGVA